MRTLAMNASAPETFNMLFAPTAEVSLSLDPKGEVGSVLGNGLAEVGQCASVDMISGGAIIQATLYALCRLPEIRAHVRVIEPEVADETNLNRYALLLRSMLGIPKVTMLSVLPLGGITVEGIITRFSRANLARFGDLAQTVVVGVDHIPTRWAAQRAHPAWLGIGATSHYAAMSSEHVRGLPCAWCLHPTDAPDVGPIPTAAFVSHWAGVLLAWRFVRQRLGLASSVSAQYDYFTPLRADLPAAFWRSPIARRPDCPNRCRGNHRIAA